MIETISCLISTNSSVCKKEKIQVLALNTSAFAFRGQMKEP